MNKTFRNLAITLKKTSFFSLVFLLVFPGLVTAATLLWGPPAEGTPTGYIVYSREAGSSAAPFAVPLPVTVEEYPITAERYEPGVEYEFWVTAYNDAGESDPAGPLPHALEVFVPPENPPPIVIRIPSSVTIRIE